MNVRNRETEKCQMKKMDLRATSLGLGFGVIIALFSATATTASASSRSTDGATAASAHGRAVLTLEDVKVFLGLKNRDPSSTLLASTKAEREEKSISNLKMDLSDTERKELTRQIAEIDVKREALKKTVDKEATVKKAEIREKRIAIQKSRVEARSDTESSLGKNLFENLIAEGNLEAQSARKMTEFDAAHLFVIEFHEEAGNKHVDSIIIGKNVVWNGNTLIAKQ